MCIGRVVRWQRHTFHARTCSAQWAHHAKVLERDRMPRALVVLHRMSQATLDSRNKSGNDTGEFGIRLRQVQSSPRRRIEWRWSIITAVMPGLVPGIQGFGVQVCAACSVGVAFNAAGNPGTRYLGRWECRMTRGKRRAEEERVRRGGDAAFNFSSTERCRWL